MKGNGKAVPCHFRGGLQAAARIIRPPSAGEFHTYGLRRVISNAHVVGNDDQNYFASADAKVCDAWVRWAVSRPWGAKGAGGVRAGRCFALKERKMRAWGGAETLFCARGAQNACFLECCFAPGGRKRRIFRFDEGEIGNLNAAFLRKMRKKGLPFCAAACYDNSVLVSV